MSLTDSHFFSLPHDREGFGSLERLIDRDWDGTGDEIARKVLANVDNLSQEVRRRNGHDNPQQIPYAEPDRTSIVAQSSRNGDLIDFGAANRTGSDFIDFDNAASKSSLSNSQFESHNNLTADYRFDTSLSVGDVRDWTSHQRLGLSTSPAEQGSTSLPADDTNRNQSGNGYGSMPGGDEMAPSNEQALTYCVHGKPGAGCCATLVNEPTAPTINISSEEHCHVKERDTGVNKKARRQIIVVSMLCLFFMIAESVGGYLSGSLAIATDAAHLLTDFAGFMISLLALHVAARKPSRIMPFGWHRAEVIGAMISVLTIWLVTGILVYMAVERLIHKNFEIDAFVMLITSAIGVIVNIIMALTLHQHSHVHTHCAGGGHHASTNVEEKRNINVRAAFIHIIGDLLQSIGVFIAATIIYYNPSYSIVDPICTFLFSILVLLTTFNIMKDALLVLMEGIPRDVDYNEVLSTLLAIDGVIRVHNLRIWALSLDKTALSAHLAIAPSADCTEILKAASKEIHKKYNFFEMTLQIEYFQQNMETCTQCQVP